MLATTTNARSRLRLLLVTTPRAVVAATCGVNLSTVARWLSGKRTPTQAHRESMERFEVSAALPW